MGNGFRYGLADRGIVNEMLADPGRIAGWYPVDDAIGFLK